MLDIVFELFKIGRNPVRYLLGLLCAGLFMAISAVYWSMQDGDFDLAEVGTGIAERMGLANFAMAGVEGAGPLATYLPRSAADWTGRGTTAGDAVRLSGSYLASDNPGPASVRIEEIALYDPLNPNFEERTYFIDGHIALIAVERLSSPQLTAAQAAMSPAEIHATNLMALQFGLMPVVVHGAGFVHQAQPADKRENRPALDIYTAGIAGQVRIDVISTAPIDQVARLIAAIDVAGLEDHTDLDDPGVDLAFGVMLGDDPTTFLATAPDIEVDRTPRPAIALVEEAPSEGLLSRTFGALFGGDDEAPDETLLADSGDPDVSITAEDEPTGPAVVNRGGGSALPGAGCRIENGVRRCTVQSGG